MDEGARAEVFADKFDLGSRRHVDASQCTYDALADEINKRQQEESKTAIDATAFKTIAKGIQKLTGQKVGVHAQVDKLITLKVIKLFFLVMRDRNKQSVFGLIAGPEHSAKAGLEYREAYPNANNREGTWLVADLKAYLSLELDRNRIAEIELTFSHLMEAIENTVANVDRVISDARSMSYPQRISAYTFLADVLGRFRCDSQSHRAIRLDELLYVHLSSLEFRHYAKVYSSLVDVATPSAEEITIDPIASEMNELAQYIVRKKLGLDAEVDMSSVRDYDCAVQLEHFSGFASAYGHEVRTLVGKAVGVSVDAKTYDQSLPYVRSLLVRVCIFERGQVPLEETVVAKLPQVISAFCAVHYEQKVRKKRTNHKPYWFGQQAEGGSLLASLLKPSSDAEVLEEHSQIWRCRMDWFQAAIRGQLDLYKKRVSFRIALIGKFGELAQAKDTDVVARNIIKLIDHVKAKCFASIEAT